MEWWKEEEREKYVDKTVTYNNSPWIVKEVFWKDTQEEFEYWIEHPNGKLQVVGNKDIELLN